MSIKRTYNCYNFSESDVKILDDSDSKIEFSNIASFVSNFNEAQVKITEIDKTIVC
jgi:hypothetical protein